MRHGKKGEVYQVCSGKAVTIKTVLDTLLKLSTVPDIAHEYDPDKMRPVENSVISGSAKKLESLAGWAPSRSIESTLADILDECRQSVREQIAG
jgi:GDP-4-dehydro-6-deoxy-D-mannose reductase